MSSASVNESVPDASIIGDIEKMLAEPLASAKSNTNEVATLSSSAMPVATDTCVYSALSLKSSTNVSGDVRVKIKSPPAGVVVAISTVLLLHHQSLSQCSALQKALGQVMESTW
eukprot:2849973-Rhodomonas_salina.1